jgi:hypothetical protein
MPNYTTHYKLKKPLQEEFYDIDDHNGNMDIIDEQLKLLSEDSGVIISPDEPEKGDVWIDTDDEEQSGGGVTSVNGKTGDVNLIAKDVDAYATGETYTKTEVNELLKNKSESSHKHSADDINEGTLPIIRGGTGATTASEALKQLNGVSKLGDTMTGVLKAQNNTSYTIKQVRNVFLIAEGASLPSGANGDICLIHEV